MEVTRSVLSAEDYDTLSAVVTTLKLLTQELERKHASLGTLRKLLFGPATEKSSRVLGKNASASNGGAEPPPAAEKKEAKKVQGHGRNGAVAYTGAARVKVPHQTLRAGHICPSCGQAKVRDLPDPAVLVRVTGMAPLMATVYELDQKRCNTCNEVFTAQSPPGVGDEKYDETVPAMIGMLKYGLGMPFNRIEKLQQGMGIPLPAATQWDLVHAAEKSLAPAHDELIVHAAQGDILHNDDTTARILALMGKESRAAAKEAGERTGLFTTGIVSVHKKSNCKIALFITGTQHAGENLKDVLTRRCAQLPAPIQMCDGLSRNAPKEFQTVMANCMTHARRYFVDVVDKFPDECTYVIETLAEIYRVDALARDWGLDDTERLYLHQERSEPRMKLLHEWLAEQLLEGKVEPNSVLGTCICYMLARWDKLTLFLTVPGAPLDNNIVERALKKAVMHRKSALFFKTLNGARVGDTFMSLIHTAELHHANPFDYLVVLLRHRAEVAANPGAWMPWNYRDALLTLPQAA